MKNIFRYEQIYKSKKSNARVGKIFTSHGVINTPNFVAVGTNGTLKAIDNVFLEKNFNQELMFCNTYHLLIHPGTGVIKEAGGIHNFINRKSPIITDSGGFQIFSLAYGSVKQELKSQGKKKFENSVIEISDVGVKFRSYRDGSKIFMTAESSIQAQKDIGADIIIAFDELLPYHTDPSYLRKSLDRTHRWEQRSLFEHQKNLKNQGLYSVIHGGINKQYREESAKYLTNLPFEGHAIGGSLGKNFNEMFEIVKYTMQFLPQNKPNHLLGIGDLKSIRAIIPLGIDTFDSSYPTKTARHGHIFTAQETIKITQTKYKNVFQPIEKECQCYTCKNYTLAYLHHLFKAREPVICTLLSCHNIFHIQKLMEVYRTAILNDEI